MILLNFHLCYMILTVYIRNNRESTEIGQGNTIEAPVAHGDGMTARDRSGDEAREDLDELGQLSVQG